jgi:diguanylate cyclase (GGDEF)-like protein
VFARFAACFASPDVRDERPLMAPTAGVLWIVAAVAAGVAQLLPGSPDVIVWLFAALEAFVILYGLSCIRGVVPWTTVPMLGHALSLAALLPVVGLALWATGGMDSYIQPLVLFPLLHIAYFFPIRMAAPLVVVLNLTYAAPLVYEAHPTADAYPGRVLCFVVASALLTVVLQLLKGRLMHAEMRQREMARTDALTGLANRRGFDDALGEAIAARGDAERGRRSADAEDACAVIVVDLDGFKVVNDTKGHAAGDELLRAVADGCAEAVRPADTLARIGGDEFAVVAPAAGAAGAERLTEALETAVDLTGARATIAWAVHGTDGTRADDLLRVADRRLYARKASRPTDSLLRAV